MPIKFPDVWGVKQTWPPKFESIGRDKWKVGSRVQLKRDVERYPSFNVDKGEIGTIVKNTKSEIYVEMDNEINGGEDWNNCIIWYLEGSNNLDEVEADLKIIGFSKPSKIISVGKKVRIKEVSSDELYENAEGQMEETVGRTGIVKELGSFHQRRTAWVQFPNDYWWYYLEDLEVV